MAQQGISGDIAKISRKNEALTKRLLSVKLRLNSIRQHLNQESTNTKELHKREYYDRMLQQKLKKNEEEKKNQEFKMGIQLSKVDDEIAVVEQSIKSFIEKKEAEINLIRQQIATFTERKEKEIEHLKNKKEHIEEKCETKCEALENDVTIQNYIREIQLCDENLAKDRPKKLSEIQLENEIKLIESEMAKNNLQIEETIKNYDDLNAMEQRWQKEQDNEKKRLELEEQERERIERIILTKKRCFKCANFINDNKASGLCASCETPEPAPAPEPAPEPAQNILIAMEHRSVSEVTDTTETTEEFFKRRQEETEEALRRIELMRQNAFEEVKQREEEERVKKDQAKQRLEAKRKELLAQADKETDSKKSYSLKYDARNLKLADFY